MSDNRQVELLIQELQNRIGALSARYEGELASLKVQASLRIEELEEKIKTLEEENG